MDKQPEEIIVNVCQYLGWQNNIKIKLVCKRFNKIISSKKISGLRPKNIFDLMLNDKIYHMSEYINLMNKSIDSLIIDRPSKIFYDELSKISLDSKFINLNILELFYLVGTSPKICKYFKHLVRSKIPIVKYEWCINYILKHFIFYGDIQAIQKIIIQFCKSTTCKASFFDYYYPYILICSSVF